MFSVPRCENTDNDTKDKKLLFIIFLIQPQSYFQILPLPALNPHPFIWVGLRKEKDEWAVGGLCMVSGAFSKPVL